MSRPGGWEGDRVLKRRHAQREQGRWLIMEIELRADAIRLCSGGGKQFRSIHDCSTSGIRGPPAFDASMDGRGTAIAMDEFAIQKCHRCATVIVDPVL